MVEKKNPSNKETAKNIINKISGWLIILTGISLLYFLFFQGDPEYSRGILINFIFLVSGIAFIFLGTYMFKLEKWAIILAGVYGIFDIVNNWYLVGLSLFNFTNIFYFVLSFTPFFVIINWYLNGKSK